MSALAIDVLTTINTSGGKITPTRRVVEVFGDRIILESPRASPMKFYRRPLMRDRSRRSLNQITEATAPPTTKEKETQTCQTSNSVSRPT